jgi:hypothetical protein
MTASTSAVRVLTVRQPHADLLIHGSPSAGIKDVENRSKPTRHRGILLIQSALVKRPSSDPADSAPGSRDCDHLVAAAHRLWHATRS